ncbi:MAG TPA: hypothetical protein VJX23_03990 [Candidatus Binataceae bacterium]|nr:hypothetical protein [Candidatus Binataceae bacterium]
MASAMGFFDKLLSSPDTQAVADLAELAGRKEALIERLTRHARVCEYPAIRSGLETIAIQQSESFETLRTILADRDTWPRPPESAPHDGSNNWERLTNDLTILATLAAGLQKASSMWQGIDSAVAAKLESVAIADLEAESDLRKLALKCDPQALD